MKKLFSLVLVVAIVLSVTVVFSACGNSNSVYTPLMPQIPVQPTLAPTGITPESAQKPSLPVPQPTLPLPNVTEPSAKPTEPEVLTIVGKWTAEVDMSPLFNAIIEAQLGKALLGYVSMDDFYVALTIEFDANGQYKMSLDERSAERAWEKALDELEDDLTQLVKDIRELSGQDLTEDDIAKETFGMTVGEHVDAIAQQINLENLESCGEYELDGDRLYMDGSIHYYTIRLTEDALAFLDYSDSNTIDMQLFRNVEFERQ